MNIINCFTRLQVASARESSSRNKLNVTIMAPLIIIPVDSTAELTLMVDLGQLKVYNTFSLVKTQESDVNSVITDNMVVKLTDLKLSK